MAREKLEQDKAAGKVSNEEYEVQKRKIMAAEKAAADLEEK